MHDPEDVFQEQISELETKFNLRILESNSIDEFEKKHAVIIIQKV